MQNKGLVKLFALLFGLVSIFQLSFTLKSNQIENEVDQIAISSIPNSEPDFDKKRSDFRALFGAREIATCDQFACHQTSRLET